MKRKIASLFLSTILLSAALTGCSSKGAESNKSEGKDTIVYSMNTAPQGIFNPLISNLPVVFLTGVNSRELVEGCLKLGPDGYLLKTVDKNLLIKKVKEVIG